MSPARLTRNNENEFEYPKAKKRKTSIHDRSVNGSIVRLECNNITSLHAFDTSFLNDFNSINSSKSPEILMENDMIIKAEILDSITIKNENEEIDLIESKDDKCEISERIIKPTCKMTSPMKAKRNKRINGVLIEEEKNIMKELRDIGESEEISDDDKEKLENLHVKLIHEVLPQHKIESNAGCRGPRDHEKKLFEKYGPLRKGTYSLQEDEIIKKNWKMFCKVHNWKEDHVKPFLSLKHNGKYYIRSFEERQKFVQFLANGLSWRTLYSVYWRFKNLYHNRICQRYSPEEDEKIITYVEKKKNNLNKHKVFSDLSRILNRSKQSIWMHYEFIIKKRNVEEENIYVPKPVWTLPLIKRYIKKLVRLTLCDDIQELKNAIIPKVVWKELEKKLNIDHKTLKNFWVLQLHMQLFCPNIIYMNDVKIQLIEYMFEKGIADSREIVWGNLVKYFDGMTSSFLNKTFVYLMKEFDVKKYRRKSFLDAIEYLYEKKISEIKKHKLDRYLPRIQYTNGNIEIITEEKMNKLGER
ncbi:transcription termination factor 1-like isoform X1 [Vespa velutina]|uniref:transcription termination factor 1-like isoform X1 n=1 Tax=Vespa velutina TaxID=202808 RepID=UPI001FB23450|nr:transcription termination factor 1-like isoform X1 [Vespa velutina]XP_047367219.1 transcription termination factor 1-like isoform X1 [Vespa velutina]XP_047367220.1 transcription termination factor 1-like isoform X1 [Vespa velutina]XP_047367221.1 transcription termination factor 1-like isoform X1 [Vespa velutina]